MQERVLFMYSCVFEEIKYMCILVQQNIQIDGKTCVCVYTHTRARERESAHALNTLFPVN